MHKKKILFIPSWYPTPENVMKGSFFREQALLFKDHFDFFVVIIAPLKVGVFNFLCCYIKKEVKYFNIQIPPDGIGIIYLQIKYPKFLSIIEPVSKFFEILNYRIMFKFSFLSLTKTLNKINWKPDLIHAQSVVEGGIFAHYLSNKFKIPYIITEHQVFLLQYFSDFKIKLIFNAFFNAKKVLAVSEHQKRQILMNGIICYPLVVGNCVDESVFFINKEKTDVFSILVVTYPSYIKDNETLFNAIKVIKSEGITDFKVLIIGGDFDNLNLTNENNPLYKQAQSFGIGEHVQILNYIDRVKMPEYYNKSDVFVSTSIAETFGVSQCEAMMCGVPVIATANGGIDDMISEKNGIKIPIQDYQALGKAILQIKNKELHFNPFEIRNSVISKFGKNAFKNRLLEVYNNI